ncbi:restriction endonuclease subunit S [Plantactinospora sp. B6F1]|uniref:restriction endonuclease subunit S n=1 Tax=Plantactinospora sp. B6F1 TaxID=3158971 RepID=UPI0032D92828
MTTRPSILDPNLMALWPHPGKVDLRFLYQWLQRFDLASLTTGSSVPQLNKKDLDPLPFPLPPLEDQQRIARVLDRADELRVKRRSALAHLGELTKSIFLDMFGNPMDNPRGDEVRPLVEWVDVNRPITYGILKPGENRADGVKYIRVVDIKDGAIDLTDIRSTTSEISHQYRRSTLRRNDLLMSIRGHVGRLAQVPAALEGANITQDSARLAVNEDSARYVMECLRSSGLQRWMKQRVKGAAVQGINLADVKMIPLPTPPLALQQEFAHKAITIDHLKSKHSASLSQLDELFASLQDRAFRGEL